MCNSDSYIISICPDENYFNFFSSNYNTNTTFLPEPFEACIDNIYVLSFDIVKSMAGT